METPPSPSEPKTVTIEAKDFPIELLSKIEGTYIDTRVQNLGGDDIVVSLITTSLHLVKVINIKGYWLKEGGAEISKRPYDDINIQKWEKTTKSGKITLKGTDGGANRTCIVTIDCETKTLSGTVDWRDGTGNKYSFNGTKID